MNCRGLRDRVHHLHKNSRGQVPAPSHCLLSIKHCLQSNAYYLSWGVLRSKTRGQDSSPVDDLGGDSRLHQWESGD